MHFWSLSLSLSHTHTHIHTHIHTHSVSFINKYTTKNFFFFYKKLISTKPKIPGFYYFEWNIIELKRLLLLLLELEFFTSVLADGLSLEFEWQQVSRTLLSILAVLNNAVVWMVSTRPPTSKSSSPLNNPLVTVPKAPITIGITVTFMFHSFFNSLARSR